MAIAKIKLPFGLNECNALVHITDVEGGKKCSCVCPSCQSPLIAAKGGKNQHHFKHAVANECEGGLESAIHLAAKKIILEKMQITLPEYKAIESKRDSRGVMHSEHEVFVRGGTIMPLHSAQEEKELPGMKADILAKTNNRPLIIEIFYRHKVDDYKVEKINIGKISAIEINLSDLTPEDVKDWETFWSCINDPERSKWLYNSRADDEVHKILAAELAKKIQDIEKRYILDDVKKQREEKKEKQRKKLIGERIKTAQLLQDQNMMNMVETLSSKKYITKFSQEAESHPLWKSHSKSLQLSLNELPFFLNLEVPNGDWLFSCDRRVWQAAVYSHFICNNEKQYFSIKWVYGWLNEKGLCKFPRLIENQRAVSRNSDLLNAHFSSSMPSPWITLRGYFQHLYELGILEYFGKCPHQEGNYWFKVICKMPSAKRSLA